jgi:hypothetical protein
MVARTAIFRNRRYNSYVPACAYAADIIHSGAYEIDFGTPAAASATFIATTLANGTAQAGVTVPNSTTPTPFTTDTILDPFGRNLQVVASAAATNTLTIRGRDYLGQPVREDFTLNGTTPVVGVKAFKWIDTVTVNTGTGTTTVNIGTGARLGLPYRMAAIENEIVNGVVGTVGTFTAGSLTDPQTATTADPRGLYTPNGTVNGTNRFLSQAAVYNVLNTNGNGGIYGIAHFNG